MKYFILFLVTFTCYSQDFNSALNMHNTIRGYFDLKPLSISDSLTSLTQERAVLSAKKDKIMFENDKLGQSGFFTDYITISRDYFLEATIGWILENYDEASLNQLLCEKCESVGFGVSMSDDKVYVIAVYDKLYELNNNRLK